MEHIIRQKDYIKKNKVRKYKNYKENKISTIFKNISLKIKKKIT